MDRKVPKKFSLAITSIKGLAKRERYLAAFLFGSIVRGEVTDESDLDAKVVVNDESCENINHPFVGGVKLDITFLSFRQLEDLLEQQKAKQERIPMLAESIILFDKTGKLGKLKKKYAKVKPKKYTKKDFQYLRYMLYHSDEKVKKAMKKGRTEAELALLMNFRSLIREHYRIHGRWYRGDKRLLNDLAQWDKLFGRIIKRFIAEKDFTRKYELWFKMIQHVSRPLGGFQRIEDNNCDCKACSKDLAMLMGD